MSGRWICDIETDGLLPELTKIHCVGLRNIDTGEGLGFGPDAVEEGLKIATEADEIVFHNGIAFDVPAIKKVFPQWTYKGRLTDTLVLSRVIHANLLGEDADGSFAGVSTLPKRLWGSHSLKAWGLRLGNHKGDYDGGWDTFSQEMLDYCVQDTSTTLSLYQKFERAKWDPVCLDLEHSLAEICFRIGNNGWTLDVKKAADLYSKLAQRRFELEEELKDLFPAWEVSESFVPKVNNQTRGYVKGEEFIKTKTVYFNPSSRQHIEHCLKVKYNWKPAFHTDSGQAKIDDEVLGSLDYPEAKRLAEFFLIQKRIGMLAEGRESWLKKVDADGRIRHTIVSGGTVSGRAAHRSPNLGQVPKVGAEYGRECRELFTVPDGWWLCGSDLSGLELRCLAHYLDDGGEYAKQILDGDIHTYNQKAAGLATRNQAKTFIYATMYGAGAAKIGSIVGGSTGHGAKLKATFERSLPAFGQLRKNLEVAAQRGFLRGLDGRRLYLRSAHKGLSQLLQSAGAVLCKKWVELVDHELNKKYAGDAYIVGWIHDEIQVACRTQEIAEDVGHISGRMAGEAGLTFKVKIPIAAEYRVGRTWSDTH